MTRPLPFRCPDCGRKLRPAQGLRCATQVVRRSCACGVRWQITITPHKIAGGWADIGTFAQLPQK